jgi:hypothetical protein
MALTLQSAMDLSGAALNDDAADRYPVPMRLRACNQALLLIHAKRPDLLFGSYTDTSKVPNGERVATDPFPFPANVLQPVADVTTGLLETQDAEFMDDGHVAAMLERALAFVT